MNFKCQALVMITMTIGTFGCGQSDGPARNRVSGTALYDGQPIPYGEIKFTPDAEKGGSGPQGQAMIVDGKFDTNQLDKGPTSGPQIIEITGYDGVANDEMGDWGAPLFFPYKTELNVDSGETQQEFKVPPGPKPEVPKL